MSDPSMRTIRHLSVADARRVAWKNGRGVTEELALWPPGATCERGDFDWRIARAAVEDAGPFSEFPGFERVLVVTSGAGLALEHGGHAPRIDVLPLRPQRFSGDWPTSATLLSGPVTDVNVLARRGRCRADVTVLRPGPRSLHVRELLDPGHTFVHVLSGAVRARVIGAIPSAWASNAGAVVLAAHESLWIGGAPASDGEPVPLQLELGGGGDEGVVLLVQFAVADAVAVQDQVGDLPIDQEVTDRWSAAVVRARPSLAYVFAAALVSYGWYEALMWFPFSRLGLDQGTALPEPWEPAASAMLVHAVGFCTALVLRRRLVRGHWGHVVQYGLQAPLVGAMILCAVQGASKAVSRAGQDFLEVFALVVVYPLVGPMLLGLVSWFLFIPLGWLTAWALRRVARAYDVVA